MNTTSTIFPNIGNHHKKCDERVKDSPSKISSGISTSASAIDKQASTSFILQDSKSRNEHTEIHGNQHNRNVNSSDPESYLTQPDCHRTASHDSLGDNIKNNAENIPSPREWPSCTETVKGLFTSLIPSMKEESSKTFRWDPKPGVLATSLLKLYNPAMGTFFAALLYTLAGNAKMVKASGKTNLSPANSTDPLSKKAPTDNRIYINNITMLEQIGVENDFPSNGNYELTVDLDGSSFAKTISKFSGDLNGRNHTISNLTCRLIKTLASGKVRNLIINNAHITESGRCPALIVCTAEDNSIISNVQIKNSHINSTEDHRYNLVGIISGHLSDTSRIENSFVKNCTITIKEEDSWVGGLAGLMDSKATSRNNTIDDLSLTLTGGETFSGCLFGGMIDDALSTNDKVVNCNHTSHGSHPNAGGAVGYFSHNSQIKNVTVSESRIKIDGIKASSGIVVGYFDMTGTNASLSDSTAINSEAISMKTGTHAGIWVGQQHGKLRMYNNIAINCTAEVGQKITTPTITTTKPTTTKPTTTKPTTTKPTTTKPTTTKPTTPATTTTTEPANLTTTEPAMVVDGASYLPMGLLLTGATVTSIGAACFAYSLYNGFQEGKRGRSLAMHPFTSFGRLLTNHYRQCVSSFSSNCTKSEEDGMGAALMMENIGPDRDRDQDQDQDQDCHSEYLLI